jgi:hypothetical protein
MKDRMMDVYDDPQEPSTIEETGKEAPGPAGTDQNAT